LSFLMFFLPLIWPTAQDDGRDNAGHPTDSRQDRDNQNGPASFIKDGQRRKNYAQ
jgi:hypothetical protein